MTRKHKQRRTEAELAALADGTLPTDRRERLRLQLDASPTLTGMLETQRHALAAVHTLEQISAPASLHDALAADAANATTKRVYPAARRRGTPLLDARRLWPASWRAVTAAALAVTACVAVVLALSTGSPGAPTVLQAARLGSQPAALGSPPESRRDRGELVSSVEGIPYPYWEGRFGWRTAGARSDHLAGRTVMTVFYTDMSGRRIGYSIVAGPALALPGGTVVDRRGIDFRVLSAGATTIVTWRRAGHTCILTARGVGVGTLVHLATWA